MSASNSPADRCPGDEPGDGTPQAGRPWPWWVALAAVWLVALAVRLIFVAELARSPIGQRTWTDETGYLAWAKRIADGQLVCPHPFYQDPLYAYVLGGVVRVVGDDVVALRWVHAAVLSVTPVVVALAGAVWFGRSAGVVAGLLAAVYGTLVFYDALLVKAGLGALAMAALLVVLGGCRRRPGGRWRWLVAGTLLGLAALLRANLMVLAPVLAGWAAWQNRSAWRPAARSAAWVAAGFALPLVPVCAHNLAVNPNRELIVTTAQAGPNFYIGNNPIATGAYTIQPFVRANPFYERDHFRAEALRRTGWRDMSDVEVSRFWWGEAWRFIARDPVRAARLWVRKLSYLLNTYEIADNLNMEVVSHVAAPVLRWLPVSFGWVLPLAVVGLVAGTGRARWIVFTAAALPGLATVCFFVVARYRVPLTIPLLLLAGNGLMGLWSAMRQRRWLRLGLTVALALVPTAAIAHWPIGWPSLNWSHQLLGLGSAYLQAGRFEDGAALLDQACLRDPKLTDQTQHLRRAQWPRYGPAVRERLASYEGRPADRLSGPDCLRIGSLLRWVPGEHDRARQWLERALDRSPGLGEAAYELGVMLAVAPPVDAAARRESNRRAWGLFESALEADPAHAWTLAALGHMAWRRQGYHHRVQGYLDRAYAAAPDNWIVGLNARFACRVGATRR